jgi:hypothetical protein
MDGGFRRPSWHPSSNKKDFPMGEQATLIGALENRYGARQPARQKAVSAKLKQVWQQPERNSAILMSRILLGKFPTCIPMPSKPYAKGWRTHFSFVLGKSLTQRRYPERLNGKIGGVC